MALLHNKNVIIKGITACVPKHTVHNTENPYFEANVVNAFVQNVGVEELRIADENTCTSDLCLAAAERLLEELNIVRDEVGVLVFVSQSPDYFFLPNTACILQDKLRLSRETLAFDVPLGCSGYVYGLNLIASYISSGQIKKGLLLAGETASKIPYRKDKSSSMLFGDAGTATLLEFKEGADGLHFHLGTDGSGYKAIIVPEGGFRQRFSENSLSEYSNDEGLVRTPHSLHLDGFDVFSFGISEAPKTCKKLMGHLNITNEDIDFAVFHQANKMMNEKIRKKLSLPEDKVPNSIRYFGNTSSASIPLTMVTEIRAPLREKANRLLLCGFGVGLSLGTVYTKSESIVIPELVEI